MAEKRYVQSYFDGSLFEYSQTEKPEFKEHTNSKGTVSYRKYYNKGIGGNLLWINRKNNQYLNNREEIEVVLADGDITYYVTFPVLNNNGDEVDDFVEAFIRLLPNMEKGKRYNVNNWHMKKGDVINGEPVKYNNSGVTVKNENGEKVEPALAYITEANPKGDIPRIEWKEKAGKNRPTAVSKEAKLDFLYDKLVEETARLAYSEGSNTPTQQAPREEEPKATPTTKGKVDEKKSFLPEANDDLPF